MPETNDFASEYAKHYEDMAVQTGVTELQAWLKDQPKLPDQAQPEKAPEVQSPMLPKTEPSTTGQVLRGIAETPRQAAGGVTDALGNATFFLKPLSDWLDTNVADLGTIQVSEPKTAGGRITRSLSEFLTGFIPIVKGLRAVGVTGKLTEVALASGMTDFLVKNPQDKRLADLWKELDLPQNVLTDYLASDPNDSAMEARFKSALESAGLGAATEGVLLGARWLRAANKVRGLEQTEKEFLKNKYGELSDESFGSSLEGPAVSVKSKLQKGLNQTEDVQPPLGATGIVKTPEADIYINFNRINSPDDVKAVISDMAERFSGNIKEAQRGVISQKETQKMADDLGMSYADLLSRRKGQPFNAEEAVAARRLWAASAEALTKAAVKAAGKGASAVDEFMFRKLLATHYAVQQEVIGARTETARALAAWKIPVGGGIAKARAIEQALEATGGEGTAKDMAKRLAIMTKWGTDPAAVSKFVEKGVFANSVDAIKEVWVSGLLTAPSTHIVNATSNFSVLAQQILERHVASKFGGEVVPGESLAMSYGVVSSLKDAFRLAAKSFRTGETGLWYGGSKVDLPRHAALSADSFRIASDTGLGRAIDVIGEGARIPFRLLGSADDFYKSLMYQAEVRARALRTVMQKNLKGAEFHKELDNLIRNPPEDIKLAAADSALYATFTDKAGPLANALLAIRNSGGPVRQFATALILPFIRTPSRIINYALERSPAAPLLSHWREDIAAGGARAQIALARMSLGTAAMAVSFDYADSGLITGFGPRNDPAQRAIWLKTHQPYSVKVGNKWVSYNRFDPVGMTLGLAADLADIVNRSELGTRDIDSVKELLGASIAAVSQVTINKTYLQGLANFVEFMADPTARGTKYLYQLGGTFVPLTSLSASIERTVDPTLREVYSLRDAIDSRIAGLSSKLTPVRDLWGDRIEITSELGKAYDFASPYRVKTPRAYPIDLELDRLATSQLRGDASIPSKISKHSNFRGVQVDFSDFPKVYDEYVQLAGNKQPVLFDKGARDLLSDIVENKNPLGVVYHMQPDEIKLKMIGMIIERARKMAQQTIMTDPRFTDFQDHIKFKQEIARENKMPNLQ